MTKALNIMNSYIGKKMTDKEYAGIIAGSDRIEDRDVDNWGHLVYTEKSLDEISVGKIGTQVFGETVRKELIGSLGPHLGAVMRRYNNGSVRYDRRFSDYEHIPEDTLKVYRASYDKRVELAKATPDEVEFKLWARRRFVEEPHLDQYNELVQLVKSMVGRTAGDCESFILYADSPSSSLYSYLATTFTTRDRVLLGLPILPIPFRLIEFVLQITTSGRLNINATVRRREIGSVHTEMNVYAQCFANRLLEDMYDTYIETQRTHNETKPNI